MSEQTGLPESIGEALAYARTLYLLPETPLTPVTAQALLAYVIQKDRVWLFAHPEISLSHQDSARYISLIMRAMSGEPLPHITGEQEFYSLMFFVSRDVLIPRPETETIIDLALVWLSDASLSSPQILDVGTGSGAIAVTLAVKCNDAHVTAVDLSEKALEIAANNAERHSVLDRIHIIHSDLLTGVDEQFDIIVANLPYIKTEELQALEVSHWEPHLALDGGADGLDVIRRLLQQAPAHLKPHGLLLLEIGYDQGDRVKKLCEEAFPGAEIDLLPDLAGLDRIVQVVKNG